MSKACPYHPDSLLNKNLATDMRRLANSLNEQAVKFANENIISLEDKFNNIARDLRIYADCIQPENP